jgi:hypothetical protein
MRQFALCTNCKKRFRVHDRNAKVIVSHSLLGSVCFTRLCGKCGNNDKIRIKMQKVNDLKLELMDGELSLDEYKLKLSSLLKS